MRQRNALLPVHQLPQDIFFQIILCFMNCVKKYRYYDKLRVLRLVAFSWSVLIDNYPQLWTFINIYDSEPVWRMALQNSQTAEIDVDCNTNRMRKPEFTRYIQPFLDGLLPHLTRVRSLITKEKYLESLIVRISTSSQLEALATSDNDGAPDPTELSSILAQRTPVLRTIDLSMSSLAWLSLGLTGLETIQLDRWSGELYKSQFLSILEASPALRQFSFTGTVLPDPSGVQGQPSSVRLDVLETLQLSLGGSPKPFDLLYSIAATPTSSFAFDFSADNGGVLSTNLGDIWAYAEKIVETKRRLFLGASRRRVWYAIGPGKGQFSVSSSRLEGHGRALLEAALNRIPKTWLSSVREIELEIDDEGVLHHILLSLSDLCPNTARLRFPHLNDTWTRLLGRPAAGPRQARSYVGSKVGRKQPVFG